MQKPRGRFEVAKRILRARARYTGEVTDTPAPWEQQPGEPDDAFALFERFACVSWGVKEFAEAQGEPQSRVASWSWRYRWIARREAYTQTLTRSRVAGAIDAARAQGAEHVRATTLALEWSIESMIARKAKGEILKPSEIATFTKMAIELQRLAAGEPTSRIAADLSHLSDERIDELREEFTRALTSGVSPTE